ncbi:MAG: RNA-binding protein [Anaerolineales bacterium]|nr:RNA-binding protein [Anaerolineales bacterium]MCB8953656.1 RNA-binding protein [Ardenticatenales bacterium]
MSKKLYVGNLSFQATEADVQELFESFGTVESIAMINDRDSGRFRGFCFVEMEASEADAAIASLDGKELNGRSLRVNEARPMEQRSGGGFRGGGGRSDAGRRNDSSNNRGNNRRW